MKSISRRNFLHTAGAVTAGAVFIPNFISCSPSKKINIAIVGVGGRGKAQWETCTQENVVAMCDVDDNRAAEGYNAYPNAKRYKDFRKMLDEMAGKIDAVMVSTPDHVQANMFMLKNRLPTTSGNCAHYKKPPIITK